MERPSYTNCKPADVTKALMKLGGFSLYEGGKHSKATHVKSGKAWTIPRSSLLDKGYMWDMVNSYLKPLGYSEEDIFKHLWC